MKVIRYCPFCKTEHEVTYEGTIIINFEISKIVTIL